MIFFHLWERKRRNSMSTITREEWIEANKNELRTKGRPVPADAFFLDTWKTFEDSRKRGGYEFPWIADSGRKAAMSESISEREFEARVEGYAFQKFKEKTEGRTAQPPRTRAERKRRALELRASFPPIAKTDEQIMQEVGLNPKACYKWREWKRLKACWTPKSK
jgi:hypothetical protein